MGSDSAHKGERKRTSIMKLCCFLLCCSLVCASLLYSLFVSFPIAPSLNYANNQFMQQHIYPMGHVMKERMIAETHQRLDKMLHWCHFSILPTLYLLPKPQSLFVMFELTACMSTSNQAVEQREARKIKINSDNAPRNKQTVPTATLYFESSWSGPPNNVLYLDQPQAQPLFSFHVKCSMNDLVEESFTKYSDTQNGPKGWQSTLVFNENDHHRRPKSTARGRCEVVAPRDNKRDAVVYRFTLQGLPWGEYRYKIITKDLKVQRMETATIETEWYSFSNSNGLGKRGIPSNAGITQYTQQKHKNEKGLDTCVAVVGDVQSGAAVFRSAVKQIMSSSCKPDVFVHLGDAIQNVNMQHEWHSYFYGPLEEEGHLSQHVPLIFARGNHDNDHWHGGVHQHPLSYYTTGSHYNAYTVGDLYFIVLDSNMDKDEEQLIWFQRQLKSNNRKLCTFTIVVVHIAPFIEYWNQMPWNDLGEKYWGAYIRYNYVPLFDEFHVDLVLSGHSHIYQRGQNAPKVYQRKTYDRKFNARSLQSTTYVIAGGGGGELEVEHENYVENYKFYDVTKFEHHYIELKVKHCKKGGGQREGDGGGGGFSSFLRGREEKSCRLDVKTMNPLTELTIDQFTLFPQGFLKPEAEAEDTGTTR